VSLLSKKPPYEVKDEVLESGFGWFSKLVSSFLREVWMIEKAHWFWLEHKPFNLDFLRRWESKRFEFPAGFGLMKANPLLSSGRKGEAELELKSFGHPNVYLFHLLPSGSW
jgi:hypothetical protein